MFALQSCMVLLQICECLEHASSPVDCHTLTEALHHQLVCAVLLIFLSWADFQYGKNLTGTVQNHT